MKLMKAELGIGNKEKGVTREQSYQTQYENALKELVERPINTRVESVRKKRHPRRYWECKELAWKFKRICLMVRCTVVTFWLRFSFQKIFMCKPCMSKAKAYEYSCPASGVRVTILYLAGIAAMILFTFAVRRYFI